jgi:outer membrane protein assembly factor BamB
MRKFVTFAAAFLMAAAANGQGTPRGFWTVPSATPAHDSWQRAETDLSPDTVATNFKLLWKLKLGTQPTKSFQEPLLYPGMITGRGFKDFVFSTDATTLYAVDSELGQLVWKKEFTSGQAACGGANIQAVIEAPRQIRFGAPRTASGHPPAPPPSEEPMAPSQRRVGVSAGGGYFGLKGIYVLTSDGYLHEQIMATGLDYAPPVKFMATPGGLGFGLNLSDKVIYAAAGAKCKPVADALWTIDLNNTDYKVDSYKPEKLSLAGMAGPAIGADGTAYVATGSGADTYANSIVALSPDGLKVKDWYSSGGKGLNASPVVLSYKNKEYVVAPGKDDTLVLLDSTSLGGADHRTPLAESEKLGKAADWDGLAAWQDKSGAAWVYASSEGKVTAFKIDENGGKMMLTAGWTSPKLKSPAPPVVANGVVFVLDGGSSSSHAVLYALDAATGKQLFSSGDAIQSYTHLAGMSVGDGHVFFSTHDNTLYSFGIPLEH